MLTGRTAAGGLLRVIAVQRLFPLALLVTSLGFLIYWGLPRPPMAIMGLFVLGLGVALLYPLALGLAMEAAGTRTDTASARAALAGSLGILVTPALLGGLADKVGLSLAHLIVPGLAVVALICFLTAQALRRRTRLY
jgi:fucose permease